MTKAELVEFIKDYPDDTEVVVWLNVDEYIDQGSEVPIKNVSFRNNLIYIEPDEEYC